MKRPKTKLIRGLLKSVVFCDRWLYPGSPSFSRHVHMGMQGFPSAVDRREASPHGSGSTGRLPLGRVFFPFPEHLHFPMDAHSVNSFASPETFPLPPFPRHCTQKPRYGRRLLIHLFSAIRAKQPCGSPWPPKRLTKQSPCFRFQARSPFPYALSGIESGSSHSPKDSRRSVPVLLR